MTVFRGDECRHVASCDCRLCDSDFRQMERRPAGGGGGAVVWLIIAVGAAVAIGTVVRMLL